MQAPEFWNHRRGPGSSPVTRTLLEPLSWIYQAGATVKASAVKPFRPSAPVVCVGNLTLGGTGKTPVTIALLERLKAKGVTAHALTRGYGGRKRGPLRVDGDVHTYEDVGDEPLLLARAGPTWVAKSKVAGARAAVQDGAEVVIMDDGFQNPTLVKDACFVLIDAQSGLGNGRVFPAGPLREGPRAGLRRADAIIVIGEDADMDAPWRTQAPTGVPILRAHLAPRGPLPLGPVFAFAGIARPQKFFDALYQAGADLKATMTFPDHHPFTEAELKDVRENARRHNALMITTEKDYVRLPRDLRRLVHSWPVGVEFEEPEKVDAVIERAMDRAATGA